MIKLGQIGMGHNHANGKLLAAKRLPELFDIVGYAEDNVYWLEKRGNMPAYENLKRLSVDEIIAQSDAILVEPEVWNLTEVAQKCIDAGKHIHLDKPACGSLSEFKHLLQSAEDKNLVVQMGYMYRYNPGIQKCLELIKNGEIGDIYSINAEMSTFHPKEYRQWLSNFGGGIMYILGSHLIDLIVYMMGKPQKITSFLNSTGKDGVIAEDNTLAVLEYKNAMAKIYVSSVELNGWGRRQFVVSGQKGTAQIMPMERPLTMHFSSLEQTAQHNIDSKVLIPLDDVTQAARYDIMLTDFYKYIVGEEKNPFTYQHDYAVHEVINEVVGGIRFNSKNSL